MDLRDYIKSLDASEREMEQKTTNKKHTPWGKIVDFFNDKYEMVYDIYFKIKYRRGYRRLQRLADLNAKNIKLISSALTPSNLNTDVDLDERKNWTPTDIVEEYMKLEGEDNNV